MSRTLAEDIDRGRTAIGLARQQGRDTARWELILAGLERQDLLAWASELAEQDLILATSICFAEEPLRPIAITEVSRYAVTNLRFIANAGLEKQLGGWDIWKSDWWTEREHAALGSLAALRIALEIRATGNP